jgi:LAS superfamily LD-carboxypeptidase LdcB
MGSIHSLRKSCKTFKTFLQGFLVCALLVVCIDNASGKIFKPDFSSHNRKLIVSVLHTLGPFIKEKQISGSAPLLCWSELMGALNSNQRLLINSFRRFSKVAEDDDEIQPPLVRLDNQSFLKNGRTKVIPPQYVTQTVYNAYIRMNQRMQKDLGTTLRIESGYRSPAYQFYLFLSRLPRHQFNMAATNRHVALPGQSEHGSLRHPAIDLINAAGINGEDNPGSFRSLPEYRWMILHAKMCGFELSFPGATNNSAFEPWHWRYCQ